MLSYRSNSNIQWLLHTCSEIDDIKLAGVVFQTTRLGFTSIYILLAKRPPKPDVTLRRTARYNLKIL